MVSNIEIAGLLIMGLGVPIIIMFAYAIRQIRKQAYELERQSEELEEHNQKFNKFLEDLLDATERTPKEEENFEETIEAYEQGTVEEEPATYVEKTSLQEPKYPGKST